MLMLYFSGTGNSKYVAELFAAHMDAACHSIEEEIEFSRVISDSETIAFCYPIYVSRVPEMMRNFVYKYKNVLKGKRVIIFCTQVFFSGDGARAFAALFPKGHIDVRYAEHFLMPNNISNLFFLPPTKEERAKIYAEKVQLKMERVCEDIKNGRIKRRGFSVGSRIIGAMQAVFLRPTEKLAKRKIFIHKDCNLCGLCVKVCPTKNLLLAEGRITHQHRCTMCYRCVNDCPKKAISIILSGKVRRQYRAKF